MKQFAILNSRRLPVQVRVQRETHEEKCALIFSMKQYYEENEIPIFKNDTHKPHGS